MKGNVIGFDPDTNIGAISGYDGNRYDFVTLDWRAPGRPRSGDVVDFQAVDRRATEIYLLEPQYVAPNFAEFYFSATGRVSRSQYWLRFMLPYWAISLTFSIARVLAYEKSTAHSLISALASVFALVALWPAVAMRIKRIHDRNKPGWMCLILYVPLILTFILMFTWLADTIVAAATGAVVAPPPPGALGVSAIVMALVSAAVSLWFFVEFGCMRGTIGANRYGPDPVRRS